jgi:hypothetical protein
MKLQLGFEDIPYAVRYSQASPMLGSLKKRRPKKLSTPQLSYGYGKTTGQIATELEKKYKIVETFYGLEEDHIVDNFEGVFVDGLKSGMSGGAWDVVWNPVPLEGKFRRSLSGRRFDGLIRGVPTLAAQKGVSHLFRNPYAQRAPRPSFIDTSLYQRSFKAWMEP